MVKLATGFADQQAGQRAAAPGEAARAANDRVGVVRHRQESHRRVRHTGDHGVRHVSRVDLLLAHVVVRRLPFPLLPADLRGLRSHRTLAPALGPRHRPRPGALQIGVGERHVVAHIAQRTGPRRGAVTADVVLLAPDLEAFRREVEDVIRASGSRLRRLDERPGVRGHLEVDRRPARVVGAETDGAVGYMLELWVLPAECGEPRGRGLEQGGHGGRGLCRGGGGRGRRAGRR